jgi:hypothetical protein
MMNAVFFIKVSVAMRCKKLSVKGNLMIQINVGSFSLPQEAEKGELQRGRSEENSVIFNLGFIEFSKQVINTFQYDVHILAVTFFNTIESHFISYVHNVYGSNMGHGKRKVRKFCYS